MAELIRRPRSSRPGSPTHLEVHAQQARHRLAYPRVFLTTRPIASDAVFAATAPNNVAVELVKVIRRDPVLEDRLAPSLLDLELVHVILSDLGSGHVGDAARLHIPVARDSVTAAEGKRAVRVTPPPTQRPMTWPTP